MNIQCPNCFENFDADLGMCPHCGYVDGEHAEESSHMNPGTVLQNRYHIGRVLGYGGFGVTYLAWDLVLATKVAIKEYLPSEFATRMDGENKVTVYTDGSDTQYFAGLNKFLDEAKRLAKFHGEPGIVGVYDNFKENNTAYIVMELLEGETLKSFLEREGVMPVDSAIGLLAPVIHSLKAVHKAGIIHRDIAPDNIMITKNGEVKLIDFGAARYAAAPKKTIIVKSGFSPLEQYQSKKEQGTYTDVFALASVLYYMITGKMPSDAPDRRASIEQGKKDPLAAPSAYAKDISPNVEAAILNAMNLQVRDRTQDMDTFFAELTEEKSVKRKAGNVKKIDVLKWPLWAKIVVPVGGVAVIAALAMFFAGVIGFNSGLQTKISIPDGMVRVPSVVNDTTDTARERITDAKLSYLISGKNYSEIIPSDYVLAQDKISGTVVMENTVVGVTVSKGVETSYVEDVSLINEVEATCILEDAGFDVVIKTEYSEVVAEGSVISQSEEKDMELEVGSTVTLTVSVGMDKGNGESTEDTETISVPDFSGMTYDEALIEAEDAGVVLTVTERTYTDEADADTVLTQSVDVGEKVSEGTVVELSASLGEEYVRTADVQYQPEEEAVEDLEGLDIHVEYEESLTVKEGLVISQSIDAGEKAEPEEEITITVSTGAPKFEMPYVTDGNIDEVRGQLNNAGLVVFIGYEQDMDEDEGTVLDQSIEAGEEVSLGTEVTLTVSTKDEVEYLNDVVGERATDASEILIEQGFNVVFSDVNGEELTNTVDSNLVVIDQLPGAESGQKKETTIVLTVGEEETGETEETDETDEADETNETEESERTGENEDDNTQTVYRNKLAEMAEEYGVVISSQLGIMLSSEDEWLLCDGLLSAAIMDFDMDGIDELLVFISETCECGTNELVNDHHIMMYMYELEDEEAVLSDSMLYAAYVQTDGEEGYKEIGLSQSLFYNMSITVNAVVVDDDCYIVCGGNETAAAFEDGSWEGYWAIQYVEGEFKYVCSFAQTSTGSSMLSYNAYEFLNGKCVTSSSYSCMKGDNCFNNLKKIFRNYRIVIDDEKISNNKDIILADDMEAEMIFKYINELTTSYGTVDANDVIAEYSSELNRGNLLLNGYDETELVIPTEEEYIVDSGECGANLTWTLDRYGLLMIAGTGDMYSFLDDYVSTPWDAYKSDIVAVSIGDGVTSIGDGAFSVCTGLKGIIISDSVTSIGSNAFSYSTYLMNISLPQSVKNIGYYAFNGWSTDQTISIVGRAKAPSGWDGNWDGNCDAQIIWDENALDMADYLGNYENMKEYVELLGAERSGDDYGAYETYVTDDELASIRINSEYDDSFYIVNAGNDSVTIFGIQFGDTRDEIVDKIAPYGVYDSSWSDCIYIITNEGIQIVFVPIFDDDGKLTYWTIRPDEDGIILYDFEILEAENSYDRSELLDWQLAYIQYIKDSRYADSGFESVEYYVYTLARTSGDTIPALLQVDFLVNTNTVCTYQDGKVVTTDVYGFPYSYNPSNNTVFFGISASEAYQLREYRIEEDGSLTDVHYFFIENYTWGDPDLCVYYVDGEKVSKEDYDEKLAEETNGAVSVTDYKDNRAEVVDEICSYYISE